MWDITGLYAIYVERAGYVTCCRWICRSGITLEEDVNMIHSVVGTVPEAIIETGYRIYCLAWRIQGAYWVTARAS